MNSLKLQIEKWLSVDSSMIESKKDLEKLAFLLLILGVCLLGGLSDFSSWLAILICIYVTYLNWKS